METELQPNVDNIRRTVQAIADDPGHFDMHLFINQCGTTFCLAGWALVVAGEEMEPYRERYWSSQRYDQPRVSDEIVAKAAEFLGLTELQAHSLFNAASIHTVEELRYRITKVTGVTFPKAGE